MATEGDRSLSSGISIPQWMKTRMTDKLDFEQSAFSPPENDDSFFYIRYPRTSAPAKKSLIVANNDNLTAASPAPGTKPDFTKHTPPCQKFIPETSINYVNSSQPSSKLKSNGTDDGFKGEAAKCGSSVIKVAHQMVSSQVARGFGQTEDFPPKGFDPSKRRGSRSLPNSPLVSPNTSPKGKRKLANKYFTGPFTDTDKYQGSWILSNLLGKREALSRSVGVIAEEEVREEVGRGVSEISLDDPQSRTMGSAKNIYRAKPSELREMNFWSPTSM